MTIEEINEKYFPKDRTKRHIAEDFGIALERIIICLVFGKIDNYTEKYAKQKATLNMIEHKENRRVLTASASATSGALADAAMLSCRNLLRKSEQSVRRLALKISEVKPESFGNYSLCSDTKSDVDKLLKNCKNLNQNWGKTYNNLIGAYQKRRFHVGAADKQYEVVVGEKSGNRFVVRKNKAKADFFEIGKILERLAEICIQYQRLGCVGMTPKSEVIDYTSPDYGGVEERIDDIFGQFSHNVSNEERNNIIKRLKEVLPNSFKLLGWKI